MQDKIAFYTKKMPSDEKTELCEENFLAIIFFFPMSALSLQPLRKKYGTLTEWLGSGLQNRVQQFESARYL